MELKKKKVTHRKDFDRRLRCGKENIEVGDRVCVDVQDGNVKETLDENTEGPFPVLERRPRPFVIQRGDAVERVEGAFDAWKPSRQ